MDILMLLLLFLLFSTVLFLSKSERKKRRPQFTPVISHMSHSPCSKWIKVDHGCIMAVTPWKDPHLYQASADLGLVSRRKVVLEDASITGWGTLCEGRPTFSWSSTEKQQHINSLEMLAVFLALKTLA